MRFARRHISLWILTCIGLGSTLSPARSSAQEIAILPLDGPRRFADQLDSSLKDRLMAKGLKVRLDAPELSARLRLQPGVNRDFVVAGAFVKRSKRAETYMKREQAVGQAQKAALLLEQCNARFFEPNLLVQAYLALGLGHLLQPVNEKKALAAFRSAIDIHPDWKIDAERLHPRAAKLYRKAQFQWNTPRVPGPAAMGRAARSLKLTHLVWLSVRLEKRGGVRLQVAVLDQRGEIKHQLAIKNIAASMIGERAAQGIVTALRRVIRNMPLVSAAHRTAAFSRQGVPEPQGSRETAFRDDPRWDHTTSRAGTTLRRGKRPFYRTWWFWTTVGVVATGVVASSIAATQGGSDRLPSGEAGQMTLR